MKIVFRLESFSWWLFCFVHFRNRLRCSCLTEQFTHTICHLHILALPTRCVLRCFRRIHTQIFFKISRCKRDVSYKTDPPRPSQFGRGHSRVSGVPARTVARHFFVGAYSTSLGKTVVVGLYTCTASVDWGQNSFAPCHPGTRGRKGFLDLGTYPRSVRICHLFRYNTCSRSLDLQQGPEIVTKRSYCLDEFLRPTQSPIRISTSIWSS